MWLPRCMTILLTLPLIHLSAQAAEDRSAELRLVPFPKEIAVTDGEFDLNRPSTLNCPADIAERLGPTIAAELNRAGLPQPKLKPARGGPTGSTRTFIWSSSPLDSPQELAVPEGESPERYALQITPDAVVCTAASDAGLFYGVQTVAQLIRANRRGTSLPCLVIADWPSLRWRCFQDDLTRGPSSRLETLQREVALGAGLKMNLFTYYMEHQFAFQKHPLIGPKDGSLEPGELQALVEFGRQRWLDILGNQQSFGHFEDILQHEPYKDLAETPSLLSPVKEESYQLLDDLYSEVCPLLPFPWFNVCCDETWGLGTGPSKPLADKIGVGGVYVAHIRRVHDLLKGKHQKRMMMWGDIILEHPDHLREVPSDTIMLTWGYGARESFDDQIEPFARSGYEFFVCPGVSNWNRILPDFAVATTNIRHFVRDGVKYGTIGMLNTAWDDDGESLNATQWHGYAWGAECAWNASTTDPEVFNRRVGAVLFGEPGDHFGQAIALLGQTHALPGMRGMNNQRFWQDDFLPKAPEAAIRATADRLLALVRPAIEHLEACRKEATVNADLLDSFLHGARRMELIGQRMLDGCEAVNRYGDAAGKPPGEGLAELDKILALVRTNRDAHAALGKEFERLWLAESKPHALDLTTRRYAEMVARYDALLAALTSARAAAARGETMPSPEEIGLAMPESLTRRTRPHQILSAPLAGDAPWAVPEATHRIGLVIGAGESDRHQLPIEIEVSLPAKLFGTPVRAFAFHGDSPQEIPAQIDTTSSPGRGRLVMVLPGPLPHGQEARVHVYLGLPSFPLAATAVSTRPADGAMQWLENDRVRLLLGPEGGHIYRWEVKALGNRDLTMPGERDWAGFCDTNATRNAPHDLVCMARGPALVRYACRDPSGLAKTISLFAGCSWIEVALDLPVSYYWDFDDPRNFAADGPTPGTCLFSTGAASPVGRQADAVAAQVAAENSHWAVKFNAERLALGMVSPERPVRFVIAPGAGAGGVGIERSPEASHFVTFAGLLETEPRATMERLWHTLDLRHQPRVVLYGVQARQ